MRILIILVLCFSSIIYSSNSFSNNQKPALFLDASKPLTDQRVCWYKNDRYSEGAIVIMAERQVICTAKNPNNNNSELSWLMLNEQGEIAYPKARKTIRVN